jgi:hypothetical protein
MTKTGVSTEKAFQLLSEGRCDSIVSSRGDKYDTQKNAYTLYVSEIIGPWTVEGYRPKRSRWR